MIPILLAVVIAAAAHAGPHEDFKAAVEAAKKSPTDMALRAKAVAAARKLKSAPILPEAALRLDGRAQFAFQDATSEADYVAAAQEYEKAALEAPWHPDYYFNACVAFEKARRYADALRLCRFYLSVAMDKKEAAQVQKRIGGLEYALEKPAKTAAAEQTRKLTLDCGTTSDEINDSVSTFEVDGLNAIHLTRHTARDSWMRKMAAAGVAFEKHKQVRWEYRADPSDPDHFILPGAGGTGHAKLMDGGSSLKMWIEGVSSESQPTSICRHGR